MPTSLEGPDPQHDMARQEQKASRQLAAEKQRQEALAEDRKAVGGLGWEAMWGLCGFIALMLLVFFCVAGLSRGGLWKRYS